MAFGDSKLGHNSSPRLRLDGKGSWNTLMSFDVPIFIMLFHIIDRGGRARTYSRHYLDVFADIEYI